MELHCLEYWQWRRKVIRDPQSCTIRLGGLLGRRQLLVGHSLAAWFHSIARPIEWD